MLVKQILAGKTGEGVFSVKGNTRIADVAAQLSRRRIGTVVISEDEKTPHGILSERDIVRELGTRGAGCLQDSASMLMTANPVTCAPGDTADAVLTKMTEGRFRHMPVVENAEMVGLISIGDVVKARLSELAMEKDALEGLIMGH